MTWGVPMPRGGDNPVPVGAWGKGPTCHLRPRDRHIGANRLFGLLLLLLRGVRGAGKCPFHHR